MTYGGTVPTDRPDRSRASRTVTTPRSSGALDLLDGRGRHEPGRHLRHGLCGCGGRQLHITYVFGTVTVEPGHPDGHRVVADDGLRRTAAGRHAPSYAGFVNGDTAAVADHAADLHDHGHLVEPGGQLPEHVLGRVDPNYTISYVDGTVQVTAARSWSPPRRAR